MKISTLKRIGLSTLSALLLLTGCSDGVGEANGLPDDGPVPQVTRVAAMSFVQKALTAGQSAVDNRAFNLVLTDAEVTSFLGIRSELTRELEMVGIDQVGQIEGLEELSGVDINIDAWQGLLGTDGEPRERLIPRLRVGLRKAQVLFKADGRVIARGYLAFLKWRVPVRIVVAPHATEGEMVLDFVEGSIGRVQMPEIIFDLLGKGIAKLLLAGQDYAEISQIQVGAGTFAIAGQYHRLPGQ